MYNKTHTKIIQNLIHWKHTEIHTKFKHMWFKYITEVARLKGNFSGSRREREGCLEKHETIM